MFIIKKYSSLRKQKKPEVLPSGFPFGKVIIHEHRGRFSCVRRCRTRYAPLVRDISCGCDMFALQTRYALRAQIVSQAPLI